MFKTDISKLVAGLIKELGILHRAESAPGTSDEVAARTSKRQRLRQELVQVLHLGKRP